MNIYIDTNAIIEENFFRSAYGPSLLRAAHFLGLKVYIPAIVVDEAKENFSRRLREKLRSYNKSFKELKSLIEIESSEIDIDEKIEEYQFWLDKVLDDYGVVILSYPEVPLKDVVAESYKGKKPFKDSGEGYKDFLVWKSIQKNIKESTSSNKNYFITNNTKDFCENTQGVNVLHRDLLDGLEVERKPEVYTHLKQFFNEKILPQLQGIELADIPELSKESVEDEVQKILEEELSSYSAHGFEGVPFGNEVVAHLVSEAEIGNITLKKIDEDEVLITATGTVEVEVDGFMDKHEYYSEDYEELSLVDGDWNDHMVAVSYTLQVPYELALSYSKDAKKITENSLSLPTEEHFDYYK